MVAKPKQRIAEPTFTTEPEPNGDTGDELQNNGAAGTNFGTATIIDPAEISGSGTGGGADSGADTGKPKGKRGRKKGSTSAKKKADLDLSALNSLLFTCHVYLAKAVKAPELELSVDEATNMGNAVANVARFYDFSASEKTIAWGQLALTVGFIYAPRVYAISERGKMEKNAPASGVHPAFAAM
jgi:hypothetical protein